MDHPIVFNDPAYVAYTGTNPEYDSDKLRYGYTSLTTPSGVYEHDLNTTKNTLLKQQEVVGTFNAADYVSAAHISEHGRLGRSWGCPAVSPDVMSRLLKLLPEGSLLYVHAK